MIHVLYAVLKITEYTQNSILKILQNYTVYFQLKYNSCELPDFSVESDNRELKCKSMRLNFQEQSELKIQSRIDPLELSRGSPGLIPRRLRRGGSLVFNN